VASAGLERVVARKVHCTLPLAAYARRRGGHRIEVAMSRALAPVGGAGGRGVPDRVRYQVPLQAGGTAPAVITFAVASRPRPR
jgi:hypothetical protein